VVDADGNSSNGPQESPYQFVFTPSLVFGAEGSATLSNLFSSLTQPGGSKQDGSDGLVVEMQPAETTDKRIILRTTDQLPSFTPESVSASGQSRASSIEEPHMTK